MRMMSDEVDCWISGLEAAAQRPSPCALLAPAEDQAGWELALWRLCLRQIVRRLSHLFYQFTDLLCAGSSALITTAPGPTRNLLDSISSDAAAKYRRAFCPSKASRKLEKVMPLNFLYERYGEVDGRIKKNKKYVTFIGLKWHFIACTIPPQ